MKHWKLTQWCTYAVSRIKYDPDRRAVYDELRQHLDDRCESFLAQGLSEEEAAEKTVAVMGDPKELAPQLAAIHRPFWGYACSITKWLGILTLAAALVIGLWNYLSPYIRSSYYSRYRSPDYSTFDPYKGICPADYGAKQKTHVEPGLSFTDSGYTVELTDVALWTNEEMTYEQCHLLLEISTLTPWADGPMFTDTLRVRDSNGVEYLCIFQQEDREKGGQLIHTNYHTGPLTWLCDVSFGSFNAPLTWIELYYDRDGREHVLRVDLTGGDSV